MSVDWETLGISNELGEKSGNAAVTIEHELGAKSVQMVPRLESPAIVRPARLLASFAQLVQTLPNRFKTPSQGGEYGFDPR